MVIQRKYNHKLHDDHLESDRFVDFLMNHFSAKRFTKAEAEDGVDGYLHISNRKLAIDLEYQNTSSNKLNISKTLVRADRNTEYVVFYSSGDDVHVCIPYLELRRALRNLQDWLEDGQATDHGEYYKLTRAALTAALTDAMLERE